MVSNDSKVIEEQAEPESTDEEAPFSISTKKVALIAVALFCITSLMPGIKDGDPYNPDRMDEDGEILLVGFLLATLGVIGYLWNKRFTIPVKKWKTITKIVGVAFVLNTFMIPMWNVSLTFAYRILSLCLISVLSFMLVGQRLKRK